MVIQIVGSLPFQCQTNANKILNLIFKHLTH